MASTIRNAKQVAAKSRAHTVEQLGNGQFLVTSGASGSHYAVEMIGDGATCTCDWAKYRPAAQGGRSGCSHVLAVYGWLSAQAGRKVSAWSTPDDAARQRRQTIDIGDGVTLTLRKG